MKMLRVCPPHLSDVATLPWEVQKSHFQQCYPYKILIIYVISEEKNCKPVVHPPENITTLTCELQIFFV